MKIDRKLPSNLTISELQSQRSSAIRPEEAAADAMRPYAALSDAAASAGQAVKLADERNKRLSEREDRRKGQLVELNAKLKMTEWENDPAWDEQEIDGIPTQEYMRDRWEEMVADLRQPLTQIQDKASRAHLEDTLAATLKIAGVSAATQVAARREQTDKEVSWDFTRIAANAGDWQMVDTMLSEMLDNDYITQPQYDGQKAKFDNERLNQEAGGILNGLQKAHLEGEDAADAFYQDLVENSAGRDEDLQAKVLAGAGVINADWTRIRQKETDVMIATEIYEEQEWSERVLAGEDIDLKALWAAGEFSDDPKRNSRAYERLRDQQLAGQTKSTVLQEVRNLIANGEPVFKTKGAQEAIDVIWPEIAAKQNLTPDQELAAKSEFYFATRLVGRRDSELLQIGKDDPATLVRSNPLFRKLTANPARGVPDMDLDDKQLAAQVMMANRAEGSSNPMETAETIVELTKIDTEKAKLLRDQYRTGILDVMGEDVDGDTGEEMALDGFEDMIDDSYDPPGWFTDVKEPTLQDKLDYKMYHYDGYMLTDADEDDAQDYAKLKFRTSHPMTNINGDWQIQKGGIAGDTSGLRAEYLASIKDEKFLTSRDTGFAPETLDPEHVTLENPVRDERGVTYTVFYEGRPVPVKTIQDASGYPLPLGETVTFDEKDLEKVRARTNDQETREVLNRMLEDNKEMSEFYADRSAQYGGVPVTARPANIGSEKKLLESEIAEIDKRLNP